MMPWQYKVGLVVSVALSATAAFAESDFEYFKNPALNYWGQDVNLVKPETPRLHSVKQNSPAESKAGQSGFQWNKYLSPNNDEFFKEGDYTPPAPFMEIARIRPMTTLSIGLAIFRRRMNFSIVSKRS